MESDKNTRKYHKQESQEVSPFPAGDHDAGRNRQDSMTKTNTNNKKYPQKKHAFEVRYFMSILVLQSP